jgi:hypothetical protein
MNKKINEFKVKNLELLEKISTLKSYLGLANISPAEALALFWFVDWFCLSCIFAVFDWVSL